MSAAGKPKLSLVFGRLGRPVPLTARPLERGYSVVYREDETNHCPGCGRTHWYVGRLMAECAFCATALPLAGVKLPD